MSANSGCFVFCFVADTIYFLSENDLKQQNKILFCYYYLILIYWVEPNRVNLKNEICIIIWYDKKGYMYNISNEK